MLNKKSQAASEVFKYLLVIFISAVILVAGYKVIEIINSRSCQADLARFEIDLKNVNSGLRYGEKELKNLAVPCSVDRIFILDLSKAKTDDFVAGANNIPIIRNSIETRAINNVFLMSGENVKNQFYIGHITIDSKYICLKPASGQISVFAEGTGEYTRITPGQNQILC